MCNLSHVFSLLSKNILVSEAIKAMNFSVMNCKCDSNRQNKIVIC